MVHGNFARRFPDGRIERYETNSAMTYGGYPFYRIYESIDAYDIKTIYQYDSRGRLSRVLYPDGVDQVWRYNPSTWIGAGGWSSSVYSGIEVAYVDRATQVDLDRTEWYLFFRRTDSQGSPRSDCGPFAGDFLYRTYSPRAEVVGDIVPPSSGIYDVAGVAYRYKIVEYAYVSQGNDVASVSRRMADGIGPNAQVSAAQQVVAYTYQNIAGRNRVATEAQAQTGRSYTFAYEVDVDSPFASRR